jgi:membrane protein required for colicin V production
MVISGVLALMRGFTREVFSIISWGGSAFITLWLFPPLRSTGRALLSFAHTPWVADGVTAGLVFILSLVALSYVTTKVTEKVRGADKPGPFDGTAGFIFGLARGFILVCLLYLFYGWVAQPPGSTKDPKWIEHSHFLALIKVTNAQFMKLVSKAEKAIPQNPTAGRPPRVDNGYSDREERKKDKKGKDKDGYSDGPRTDLDRLLSSNNGSMRP